ncbi:MAG: response regulator transcription factor [Anaerolineae bacterium]|nr:response regulator transcription factor [Anaerolineae bacterium]
MRKLRVLIIDEHQTVCQALENRLQSSGEVDVVGRTGSWQEGIRIAAERSADVVLLETKRSDNEGMAALRRLQEECAYTYVVVLTSYPNAQEKKEALAAGASRYLLKDIGSDYLIQEIRDVVQPRAAI